MNTNWNCEAVEPRLTALELGELPAGEAAAVRAHLGRCAACREAAGEIAATLAAVRAALAEAPEALRAGPRPGAGPQAAPRRAWVAGLRDLLDLPTTGEIPFALWPGALAKAAIIFLIPLTVAVGLLVPALRLAWRSNSSGLVAESGSTGAEPQAAVEYEIGIVTQELFAERDVIGGGILRVEPEALATANSTSGFDTAAEHWNGESLVRNELPHGNKLGLGMKSDQMAVDLANATAPILAADLARQRAIARQVLASNEALAAKSGRKEKDRAAQLTRSMAAPGPSTNDPALIVPQTGKTENPATQDGRR